ncbi:MAG TPA: hypothetical protein VFT82_01600 [Candidatus Paceibacterota bacterium]|nr:hypothetical protein [Candidatus Paceibacterota bacterium]
MIFVVLVRMNPHSNGILPLSFCLATSDPEFALRNARDIWQARGTQRINKVVIYGLEGEHPYGIPDMPSDNGVFGTDPRIVYAAIRPGSASPHERFYGNFASVAKA